MVTDAPALPAPETRAAISEFRLLAVDDPTGGLLGGRTSTVSRLRALR